MLRRLAAITAALCSLAIPSFVSAEPSAKVDNARAKVAFRLEYTAPEDAYCPTLDELSFTIGGEFGYMVVRPDASAMLRVEIVREENGFRAFVKAPDVSGNAEIWEGQTELQGACRELAYDVASLVGANLGPVAWPTDEPPSFLLAPSEKEEAEIASPPPIQPPREPSPQPDAVPRVIADVGLHSKDALPFRGQLGVFAMTLPYGLTSFALGGGGTFFARWPAFALGAELRGLVTPMSGIGDPPNPGRSSIFGAAILPCLTEDPFDFCAVAGISNIDFDLPGTVRAVSLDGISGDFGGRFLARWAVGNRLSLAGFVEATGEIRRISIRLQRSDGSDAGYNWRSPRVRVVVGVGILFSAF